MVRRRSVVGGIAAGAARVPALGGALASPGVSVRVGLRANHTGNTAAPAPFSLNGAVCATN